MSVNTLNHFHIRCQAHNACRARTLVSFEQVIVGVEQYRILHVLRKAGKQLVPSKEGKQ